MHGRAQYESAGTQFAAHGGGTNLMRFFGPPLILAALLAGLTIATGPAAAQTAVRFSLGYGIGGPAAPLFVAIDRGYFKAEGLDVTFEAAAGSLEPIARVASGTFDMGVGDINALIRFRDQNPGSPVKAVFMLYNRAPFGIIGRESHGVRKPKDLEGRKLGISPNDATSAHWPIFARVAGIDAAKVVVENVPYSERDRMLAAGRFDAVAGFTFSAPVNLKDHGVPANDIVVLPMADYGLLLYGNAIMVGPRFAARKPEAVRGFLRAYVKALKETIRDPAGAVDTFLARDAGAKKDVELERLRIAIRDNIVTPEVRANGYGAVDPSRLERAIDQIGATYGFTARPKAADAFDASFLPPAAERQAK
jgi:NitT/TauT family transport system substrate-binding protein